MLVMAPATVVAAAKPARQQPITLKEPAKAAPQASIPAGSLVRATNKLQRLVSEGMVLIAQISDGGGSGTVGGGGSDGTGTGG
jgi:hypothetical protein